MAAGSGARRRSSDMDIALTQISARDAGTKGAALSERRPAGEAGGTGLQSHSAVCTMPTIAEEAEPPACDAVGGDALEESWPEFDGAAARVLPSADLASGWRVWDFSRSEQGSCREASQSPIATTAPERKKGMFARCATGVRRILRRAAGELRRLRGRDGTQAPGDVGASSTASSEAASQLQQACNRFASLALEGRAPLLFAGQDRSPITPADWSTLAALRRGHSVAWDSFDAFSILALLQHYPTRYVRMPTDLHPVDTLYNRLDVHGATVVAAVADVTGRLCDAWARSLSSFAVHPRARASSGGIGNAFKAPMDGPMISAPGSGEGSRIALAQRRRHAQRLVCAAFASSFFPAHLAPVARDLNLVTLLFRQCSTFWCE